jgi:hypothetical protein
LTTSAVAVDRDLPHRHRLTGQRGLVGGEVHRVQQHGIGGNPVAFGQQRQVTAYDVPTGDADLDPVAHDEGTRRGQVAQGRERVLGLVLLVDRDRDHHDHERHQQGAVEWLGEEEVDGAGHEQQQQHRLTDHHPRLLEQVALPSRRELVRSIDLEPTRGFLGAQPGRHVVADGCRTRRGVRHEPSLRAVDEPAQWLWSSDLGPLGR